MGFLTILSLDSLQWPAMIVTVLASWLVSGKSKRNRNWGFWLFIASNLLWITWALHDKAYALIALQIALFVLNIRGISNSESAHPDSALSEPQRGLP